MVKQMDKENVINELVEHIESALAVDSDYVNRVRTDLLQYTVALLKEQEAVRCKNCAYALFKEGVVQHGHIVCTKPFTEHWQVVKPEDWFCADGERRTDDT